MDRFDDAAVGAPAVFIQYSQINYLYIRRHSVEGVRILRACGISAISRHNARNMGTVAIVIFGVRRVIGEIFAVDDAAPCFFANSIEIVDGRYAAVQDRDPNPLPTDTRLQSDYGVDRLLRVVKRPFTSRSGET